MARPSAATFLEHFVLPLVRGGEMHIGNPLAAEDVDQLEQDLPHASEALVAVDEARADVLAELVVRPPSLVLDGDELRLAAALYNVLFLVHPDLETWTVSRKARARVVETARSLAAQPATRSRRRVLARHGLLHNVFAIARTDTRLSWWSGSASYLGQRPPQRLVTWQSVRRVRQDVTTASYGALLGSDEAMPIMATLLRRSPLTQLLSFHPHAPALHWEDAAFLLQDPELARAVAYRALGGMPAGAPEEPGGQLVAAAHHAAAFEQMLERNPAPDRVRTVAAFLVHLSALLALAEVRQRDPGARSAVLSAVLAPERAGKRPRGLTTFLALPGALEQVDERLARPPGLNDDERLAARWRVHRAHVAEALGEAVIDTLVERLTRHLAGQALLGGRRGSQPAALPGPVEAADQSG